VNPNCWAAPLGDCEGKISSEHLVTEGLFPNATVSVQGFEWCKDQPKQIGLSNFTANILCEAHNNALSPMDDAAIQCKKAFEDAVTLMNFRMQYKKANWTRRRFDVRGALLEAWLLKTLINCAHKAKYPIGIDSTEPGRPSLQLIQAAFGTTRLVKPMGVYAVPVIGETHEINDKVNLLTLVTGKGYAGGMVAEFGNIRYLLSLMPTEPTTGIFNDAVLEKTLGSANFMYHVRRSVFHVHQKPSHSIEFHW
jgi:hypothetical protein